MGPYPRNRDESIIQECERAEDAAPGRYSEVLKHGMPRYIRDMLEHQVELIGRERALIAQLEGRPAHARWRERRWLGRRPIKDELCSDIW